MNKIRYKAKMPSRNTAQSNKEAIIEIKGELKLLHQKLDLLKDNHLSHMASDIDRLTKFVWIVGGTVFAQMCYLIVRSIM